MAYSNVGTPVFYVDNYLYQKTLGVPLSDMPPTLESHFSYPNLTFLSGAPNIFNLNPSNAHYISADQYTDNIAISSPVKKLSDANSYDLSGNCKLYCAILNHSIYNGILSFELANYNWTEFIPFQNHWDDTNYTDEMNGANIGNGVSMPGNGTTIVSFDKLPPADFPNILASWMPMDNDFALGGFSVGIKYTMPHSPDLKLSMEIEMDGVDTITTSGGSSISNIKYTGNPLWVNKETYSNPFEVFKSENYDVRESGARRNGRKSWSLKFSYMNDRDLFSSNIKADTYSDHESDGTIADHYNTGDIEDDKLYFNIETDDSFYAQVWNKTLGGALPFIFQPDSNFRDEFYICKFDQDSLKISQSAYKVYDISVKIVEVW